jgi:hypothetical protein
MASDNEQKGIDVPQHKRIAQGERLNGTSYSPKGGSTNPISKSSGGLSHVVHKKNK